MLKKYSFLGKKLIFVKNIIYSPPCFDKIYAPAAV